MKIFECEKCKSREIFISECGNNIGLYCADCGKWIKWLNKDELRLAERQIKEHDKEIRNKAIDEFVNTLIPRLTDAIYQKDVESMTNLINDVARELKAGDENEID